MPRPGTDPRTRTPQWRQVRLYVLARDRHICQIGGPRCTIVATTVDHIHPLSEGGAVYDPANLRAACAPCNNGRYHPARIVSARAKRWRYHTTVPELEERM
jgi:5-methylcytosine-specific restriction endonuclease McrA